MNDIDSLFWQKFLIATTIFLLFVLLRKIFVYFVLKVLKKIFLKTENKIDDKSVHILTGPIGFIFIIIGFNAFLALLGIHSSFTNNISKSLIIFDIFWFLFYLVELFSTIFDNWTKNYSKALSKEIIKFIDRVLKLIVISLAIMSILKVWDIDVSGFVASLGLGGLAFALAAKDTAANIFGSLAIIADKAISVGEWIEVDGVEGVVQDIGMRTTKIRNFENAIITMPNQVIANSKIKNYSRRSTRRVKFRIGLTYDTTKEQIAAIRDEIKTFLEYSPKISKYDPIIVNFDAFGDSALILFIYYFTNSADWFKYLAIKEEVNMEIMQIVEKHHAQFAFPSQSIYIEKIAKREDEEDSTHR